MLKSNDSSGYINDSPVYIERKKKSILNRLNREYVYQNERLVRKVQIKQSSMKSYADSQQEIIDKLQYRIRVLEKEKERSASWSSEQRHPLANDATSTIHLANSRPKTSKVRIQSKGKLMDSSIDLYGDNESPGHSQRNLLLKKRALDPIPISNSYSSINEREKSPLSDLKRIPPISSKPASIRNVSSRKAMKDELPKTKEIPRTPPDTSTVQPLSTPTQSLHIPEHDPHMQLVSCPKCKRRFRKERIQAHSNVCSTQKQRKTFDEEAMRKKGTEFETYKKKDLEGKGPVSKPSTKTKVKKVQSAPSGPSKGFVTEALFPCAYCGRKFNEKGLERHAPVCEKLQMKQKREPFRVKSAIR